jgi:hypothetical protein
MNRFSIRFVESPETKQGDRSREPEVRSKPAPVWRGCATISGAVFNISSGFRDCYAARSSIRAGADAVLPIDLTIGFPGPAGSMGVLALFKAIVVNRGIGSTIVRPVEWRHSHVCEQISWPVAPRMRLLPGGTRHRDRGVPDRTPRAGPLATGRRRPKPVVRSAYIRPLPLNSSEGAADRFGCIERR